MKYLFLLAGLSLLGCGGQQNDSEVNALQSISGKAEGLQKNYYDDGTLKNEVTYVAGKRNGPARQFYKNGKPESEINYKDNKKDGASKWYYEDGLLYQEISYSEGQKHGKEIKYHNNRRKMAELSWKNDEPLPGLVEYDYNGKALRQPYIVVSGTGKLEIKLSNGDEKVKFYLGKLEENQTLVEAGLQELDTQAGVAYYKPKAGEKSVELVAFRKTAMRNPQILTLSYPIP